MKNRLTKFFTVFLAVVLCIGMAPATGSTAYAASRWGGSSISSWWNGLFGGSNSGSNNNNSSSNSNQAGENDATGQGSNQLTANNSTSGGTANDIVLTKTAKDKGTDNAGNQIFDISLGVKGKGINTARPVDVTLVMDVSGSMDDNNKMYDTKKAANDFVDDVLKEGSSARISVVKFATDASAAKFDSSGNFTSSGWNDGYGTTLRRGESYYSNSAEQVKKAISSLSANGGTNTEAGAVMAKNVTDSRNRSDADSIVIFLTDGVPTYYSNGGVTKVDGDGAVCENTTFKKATGAFANLKEGSQLYSIGFLTAYTENSSEYKICESVLSNKAYYNPSISAWNDGWNYGYNSVSFTADTSKSANFTKYYGIKQGDNASTKIKSIYAELANKINVLASGTVVDKIPEGFDLTDAALEAIHLDPNADYDATNRTITYTNVEAGENTVTNTFEVKYIGNGYGAAYTNDEAKYKATLYNGDSASKDFPKPVAGLHPKTKDDTDSTSVGTTINVDIIKNDEFKKIQADGYTVSNYEIILTDKDGNPTTYDKDVKASIVDGKLKFTSSTAGTKELYYIVKADITKVGDNFAENGQTELVSRPTKVTINVYDAANQAFVVDFGKPVTYDADTVFSKSEQNATINLTNPTGTYGNMALNSDKSITYTLKKFMNGIDEFIFNEEFGGKVELNKTVTMIPGTSIYYEDNFENVDENGQKSFAITYDKNWTVLDKDTVEGDSIQEVLGDGETGYDSNYNKDDSKLSYSAGTIHMVQAPSNATAKATFEFTGTGVDIYSLTSATTGKIQVAVWKQKEDGTYPKTAIYRKTIDTKYNSGTAYQLPVVNFRGDETTAKYKVQITVGKGQTFYLDAVRIYNPIGNVNNNYGQESGVKYVSIRQQSLNPTKFTVTGDVFIDKYLENKAQTITLSDSTSKDIMNIYTNYGRKTEVVIAPGKTVTLTLKEASDFLELGARIDAEAPTSVAGGSSDGTVTVNGNPINVNSSTDMYYTISAKDNKIIKITNNTDKLIAITNLKLK